MPRNNNRKALLDRARRVVVKVGSNVLTEDQGLNLHAVRAISRQICRLTDNGRQALLVTSGAMAAGLKKIGLQKRPDDIPRRQAVSAVGQAGLIMEYENAFDRYGIKVAQVLLTSDGISNRKRYLNARNTLNTLLSWQVVPIINENDTVAVESIEFGDNDNLSAIVALLMDADVLINLTDIDGLYTRDPRRHPDARLIPEVTAFKKDIETYACGIAGPLGTGGMLSKIRAARKVTAAGIPMIIANGRRDDILDALFSDEAVGTFFAPRRQRLASRKSWIGYSVKPEGAIVIDDGAARAVLENGKSLLPSGIVAVRGRFDVGAPVEFTDTQERVLGIGLVNYTHADIARIRGLRSDQIEKQLGHKPFDEVIHRDNLAITFEE
jgi:glutamate 5-kinase